MPQPTHQQARAIEAQGNVLVLAGAGAGKTSTLVGRLLARLLDPRLRTPVDRLLVVTFTEAAATEMRHRLRAALEREVAAAPGDAWIADQLALLDTAQVCTLHAFCLQLLREHFHELGLDPQFAVLDSLQAGVMRRQAWHSVVSVHYERGESGDDAMVSFLRRHGGERGDSAGDLVLRVHDHARSLADPQEWLSSLRTSHQQGAPDPWRSMLWPGVTRWAGSWLGETSRLAALDAENFAARESADALGRLVDSPSSWSDLVTCLRQVREAGDGGRFPRNTKGRWRAPLEDLLDEAAELEALLVCPSGAGMDPLVEDWGWARMDILALLDLVAQFEAAYAAARRQAGVVDFQDLEQLALRLLWDSDRQAPSPLACAWQERLEWVCVDEYQDINGAQDRLITCLSRPDAAANRFFVGDIKQSIYRFRRADPGIFQRYAREWRARDGCEVLALTENFRSHERILEFVNGLFGALMRPEVGGVAYDADAHLLFGAPEARGPLRSEPTGRVELLVHVPGPNSTPDADADHPAEDGAPDELAGEEAQAVHVVRWLEACRDREVTIWDGTLNAHRPVRWSDMVVLHPAPRPVAECWARQFGLAGIPLEAKRGGFFEAHEVSDLVHLVRLLDNPRQDLPLLAVLRSPLVGLSDAELATVRLAGREGALWDALMNLATGRTPESAEAGGDDEVREIARSARTWSAEFLRQYERWRRLARERSISACLEAVLAETGYDAWLRSLPRADACLANVRRLLVLSRQFDQFQRHGLFRFLQYLEGQVDADQEAESAPSASGDRVRMMSVHQSKGLEFPIVVVAGLGRRFNLQDARGDWLVDDEYGICPPVIPPGYRRGYRSLPRWLAAIRQRREFIGEQVRLLYVACTRAVERLLLVGSASESALERWSSAPTTLTDRAVLRASSPLDWLGPLMPRLTGKPDWAACDEGEGDVLNWRLARGVPVASRAGISQPDDVSFIPWDTDAAAALRDRLAWRYGFAPQTREPAKAAVTGLTRRWWADEIAARWPEDSDGGSTERTATGTGTSSSTAIERGLAHHRFFELADWEATRTREGVEAEVQRILREGWMSESEAQQLDIDGLWAFWGSELAERLRANPSAIQRELPFTVRLRSADAEALRSSWRRGVAQPASEVGRGEGANARAAGDDFQVVQGVIDLAVFDPDGMWIIDFKTDQVEACDIPGRVAKYGLQLALYAGALRAIYRRPVRGAWLYFVAARRLVSVDVGGATDG